jgi:hypothetical protein
MAVMYSDAILQSYYRETTANNCMYIIGCFIAGEIVTLNKTMQPRVIGYSCGFKLLQMVRLESSISCCWLCKDEAVYSSKIESRYVYLNQNLLLNDKMIKYIGIHTSTVYFEDHLGTPEIDRYRGQLLMNQVWYVRQKYSATIGMLNSC